MCFSSHSPVSETQLSIERMEVGPWSYQIYLAARAKYIEWLWTHMSIDEIAELLQLPADEVERIYQNLKILQRDPEYLEWAQERAIV